jgi:uncharacterized membrane protein
MADLQQERPDLPASPGEGRLGATARVQVAVAAVVGICAGVPLVVVGQGALAPLVAWDAAAITYLLWTWLRIWHRDPEQTARIAVREEPSRAAADVAVLLAAVASLVAVGLVIVKAGDSSGATKGLLVGLAIASVVLSWSVLHTLFTLRYARLYYTDADGGVNFNQEDPPRYSDFAYLAFTIGMTFQVSDTDLSTTPIRATALRHALLSYLFGAVILATTINLIAGLSK